VSPFLRARQTCGPVQERWPQAPCETWDISELTYLSPERCRGTTAVTRKPMIDAYWDRCDPDYLDGPDAESFSGFMARLRAFNDRLLGLDGGFVVAVGHGQFFRAFMIGLTAGFEATPDWMRRYRATEVATPLANGEIVELSGQALRGNGG
jgi:broad specificity phosphatase PhoE